MLCLAAGWVGVLALLSELRNMPTCAHGRKMVGNEHRSAMAFHGLHCRPFSLVTHLFSYSSIDVLPIDGICRALQHMYWQAMHCNPFSSGLPNAAMGTVVSNGNVNSLFNMSSFLINPL